MDDKKITLLQILPALESGGVERGTIEIAKYAAQNNIKSLVASAGGNMEQQVGSVGATHIKLHLNSKNPFNIYRNIREIELIILENDVDIVHARSRAPAWSAYWAAKRTNRHFITTFHGSYSTSGLCKKLYNSVMVRGEVVIAISNFIAKHIQKEYSIYSSNLNQSNKNLNHNNKSDGDSKNGSNSKIQLIHRGVDMDFFDPQKVTQENIAILRKKWNLTQDYPVIFMPGRITRWKGQDFLLRALQNMKEQKFYCVIAGANNGHNGYYQELKQFIISSNLSQNVRIVDAVDDIPTAYQLSTVVVSASQRPEAFGRVAVEAQAMGKLIIATALGGSKETIIDKETGRLVNHKFTGEMSQALDKAISLTSETYDKIALHNRQHIMDNFSAELMCSKTIDIYRNLLKSHTNFISITH